MVLRRCLAKCLMQILPIGNNQGHGLLSTSTDHHYLTHKLALFQQTLNQLRRDILPVRKLEQVFLSVRDVEMAVFLDVPDVAGIEPAILEHGGGSFGLSVVTTHHVRTTHEDLAIFGNLDLDAIKGNSHGSDVIVTGAVGRHDARLRRAVTLQDRYASRKIR